MNAGPFVFLMLIYLINSGIYLITFLSFFVANFLNLPQGSRPMDLFRALHAKFAMHSPKTKALLLSAYAKFLNLYPEEQEL